MCVGYSFAASRPRSGTIPPRMLEILNSIDAFVRGPAMIVLLLGTHVFLTFKTGFIQRKLPQAIRMSFRKDPQGKGDISNFGALATALAATIGTGSIVGVATAILAGGPGAVFWMWITGVFGIATKYAEVYASVKYRVARPRRQHARRRHVRVGARIQEGRRPAPPGGRSWAPWRSPRSPPWPPSARGRPCRRPP